MKINEKYVQKQKKCAAHQELLWKYLILFHLHPLLELPKLDFL